MDYVSILIYLASNAGAAFVGLVFWWTLENMQRIEQPRRKLEQLPVVIVLTVFLTPLGAMVVSLLVRSRRLIQSVKGGSE